MQLPYIIVGGGAAGFFGACACKSHTTADVHIFERSASVLAKVRISGGGRCNVTHQLFDPQLLAQKYPRGGKALIGPFSRFGPKETIQWFSDRGVLLKAEKDGRMFPITDDSQTIIQCLLDEAQQLGVHIQTHTAIENIERREDHFIITTVHDTICCKAILVATGNARPMYAILERLGHTIIPPVPSLFTFNVPQSPLLDLAGISIDPVRIALEGSKMEQEGALLLTHWGFSGPAALRLSAWGARWLHDCAYKAPLKIGWVPQLSQTAILEELERTKEEYKIGVVASHPLFALPKNLWKRLALLSGIEPHALWNSVSKKVLSKFAEILTISRFTIEGKTTYKHEFVTCGGVCIDEVDFKTMQSKIVPGLFFAGEVLDIDGITGGFNFQNAWTTAWIAGNAMRSL